MKWSANSESLKSRCYEIKYDPFTGFYFYVFEENVCIRDYLQDTLEIAMDSALEDYGVPKSAWKRAKE